MFAVIPAVVVLHNITRQRHGPSVGEGLGDDNDGDDDHVPGAHYFGRGILFFGLNLLIYLTLNNCHACAVYVICFVFLDMTSID